MKVITLKPVEKFFKALEPKLRTKVYRHVGMLQEQGLDLTMPFSKRISKNFYELRILGTVNVRIFYTIKDGLIWLLHAFIKTTHKTPQRHLEVGIKRLRSLT